MKTNPLALDAYIRAWEIWNMIVPTSTRWDELKESHRLRWIKALDSLAPAAKEDGIPEEPKEDAMSPKKCPTCDSPSPNLHPAMQHEGEVQICRDLWHGPVPAYALPKSVASLQEPEGARKLIHLTSEEAALRSLPEQLERLRQINEELCHSHNTLLQENVRQEAELRKLRSQESK